MGLVPFLFKVQIREILFYQGEPLSACCGLNIAVTVKQIIHKCHIQKKAIEIWVKTRRGRRVQR